MSSQQTRADFTRVLSQHPTEVVRIVTLDPALLSNDPFLARYPDLADFIAKHPEVRRNPHYYLGEMELGERRAPAPFEDAVESMSVAAIFLLLAFVFAWLVRTIIEQKRWNRLSKTQAEVHNKILDRFGTTSELLWLAYAQGASHDEIAGILGLRTISVRTLLPEEREF